MSVLFTLAKAKLNPPKKTFPSSANRTILVTGANTGVGYEAAVKCVQPGAARLVLGVRSLKKGEDAKARIEAGQGTEPSQTVIEVWELDMLDYDSIKAFASRAGNQPPSLDYAILNAGVVMATYQPSHYGWETALQTSDFTPVLELVSSGNAYFLTTLLQDHKKGFLQTSSNPKHFSSMVSYSVSKLFLEYAKVALAQLAGSNGSDGDRSSADVFVVTVCPGPTQSNLARDQSAWYMRAALFLFSKLFQRTTEEGSRTYISGLTLGPKGHGSFWQYDRLREPAPLLENEKGQALSPEIWTEIVKALKQNVPEIERLVAL